MPVASASLGARMQSDNAKRCENVGPRPLEWQNELDAHLTDLDWRLAHSRRRATDAPRQPTLPELGRVELTSELLDEIAWRVAAQVRVQSAEIARGMADEPRHDGGGPHEPHLRPGKILVIRFQVPRLPWPFRLLQRRRRRRAHPLSTARGRA